MLTPTSSENPRISTAIMVPTTMIGKRPNKSLKPSIICSGWSVVNTLDLCKTLSLKSMSADSIRVSPTWSNNATCGPQHWDLLYGTAMKTIILQEEVCNNLKGPASLTSFHYLVMLQERLNRTPIIEIQELILFWNQHQINLVRHLYTQLIHTYTICSIWLQQCVLSYWWWRQAIYYHY